MTRTLEIAVVLAACAALPPTALAQASQCVELPEAEQMSLAALSFAAPANGEMSRDERLTSMTLEPRALPISKRPIADVPRVETEDDEPTLWCSSPKDPRCSSDRDGDLPRTEVGSDGPARAGSSDLDAIPPRLSSPTIDLLSSSLDASPGFRMRVERPPR
jgi:hypothetical protein